MRGFVVPGAGESLAQAARRSGRGRRGSSGGRIAWARIGDAGVTSSGAEGVRRRAARSGDSTPAGGSAGDLLAVHGAAPATQVADVLGRLRLQVAKARGPAQARRLPVPLGHRVPAVRVERRREALGLDAPSVHVAAAGGRAAARVGARARARARLRPGAERLGDRRRQHPDSSRRRAAARLPAARHLGRGRAGALRVLPRRARVRHAAARRHRVRSRSHRRAPVRRSVDPRGDRVPEDRAGRRPDGRRAVGGRRASSCASCSIQIAPATGP